MQSSRTKAFLFWLAMALGLFAIASGAWTFLHDNVGFSRLDGMALSAAYASALVAGIRVRSAKEFAGATLVSCLASWRVAVVIGSGGYDIIYPAALGVMVAFGFFSGLFFQRIARFLEP